MYLIVQISLLQPQVGGDVLVDRPGELVVQFPRDETQQHRPERYHTRRSDQTRIQVRPSARIDIRRPELGDGLSDLIHLHRRVDHHAQVVQAYPNHLDGILQAQRIPHQHQLVYEPEDENGQIRRNRQRAHRLRRRVRRPRLPHQTRLKFPEHIRLQPQTHNRLEEGHEREGPRPLGAGQVHFAATLPCCCRVAD